MIAESGKGRRGGKKGCNISKCGRAALGSNACLPEPNDGGLPRVV